MIDADRKPFAAVLTSTMQTFMADMPPGLIDVWWNVLKKYELGAIRRALSDHIQDVEAGKWAPKPADIIGRLRTRPESAMLQLPHKGAAPDPVTMAEIKRLSRPQRSGPYWTVDKVVNQAQVDHIIRQADHFGHMSEAHRFLTDCRAAGVITNDGRIGKLNAREPGEDPIEDEEAA